MAEPKDQVIDLPIEWIIPENIVNKYATNIVVQNTNNEYILSFFEIYPPLILGPAEDQYRQAKELKSVPARCVARIIVSPTNMKDFLKVIQDHINKQLAKQPE